MKVPYKIVMPAIYRFDTGLENEMSGWGWHRATELLEAVNNILLAKGLKPMHPQHIGEKFPFVNPMLEKNCGSYFTSTLDGKISSTSTPKHQWLFWAVTCDTFIPAKIGIALLKAVKSPIVSNFKRIFHSI